MGTQPLPRSELRHRTPVPHSEEAAHWAVQNHALSGVSGTSAVQSLKPRSLGQSALDVHAPPKPFSLLGVPGRTQLALGSRVGASGGDASVANAVSAAASPTATTGPPAGSELHADTIAMAIESAAQEEQPTILFISMDGSYTSVLGDHLSVAYNRSDISVP